MGRRFRPRRLGAGALIPGALAPLVVLALSWGPVLAAGPEALPDELWWREAPTPGLNARPLEALGGGPDAVFESEWSPLYRGADAARVEGARSAARWRASAGAWTVAGEMAQAGALARGGGGTLWVGANRLTTRRGTLSLATRRPRFALAASATAGQDEVPGFAFGARAGIAPGWRFEAGASREAVRGALDVRWEDTDVHASGDWTERRAHALVEGVLAGARLELEQEALDHRARPGGGRDRLEPLLGWRASRIAIEREVRGMDVRLDLEHGEGRQASRVRRDGAVYASAAGPVRRDGLALRLAPRGSTVSARLWAGRWNGSASAGLALWPFEELTGLTGTRRVARTDATLSHRGIALDRRPRDGAGWEGGLALWAVSPRAGYATWQATVMGVGRDDYSEGVTSLEEVVLAGVRLAGSAKWGAVRIGLEAVQWVPVRIRETAAPVDSGGEGGGGEGPAPTETGTRESGGTVVRARVGIGG